MPTQQKMETVAEIKGRFSGSKAIIFADYRGLSVKEMQALRTKMREAGGDVKIYKNSLALIAVRELDLPSMDDFLVGPTMFTFADEPVGPAKALMDFAKEHAALEVKGGFVESSVLGADGVRAVAALPSREQLVARLMGDMKSPMSSLVYVLNGPASALARALQAVAEQKIAAA